MPSVETLLAHLKDETTPLSIARLYWLSDLSDEEFTRVAQVWSTLSTGRRRAIMSHLVDISEENMEVDFGRIFRMALSDPDPEVRAMAIDGLWYEDQDLQLMRRFFELFEKDADTEVRARAAIGLGRYFYNACILEQIPLSAVRPAIEALRQAFYNLDEPLEVRRRALEALGNTLEPDLPQMIERAYADPDERMRVSALFAMGRTGETHWAPYVMEALRNPSPAVRYEAVVAAGEIGIKEAVPILERLIEEGDTEIQEAAIWALGEIGGPRAREILEKIAAGEDEDLAALAEEALEELNLLEGAETFMPLLEMDLEAEEEEAEDWLAWWEKEELGLEEEEEEEDDEDNEEYQDRRWRGQR
ncbi:HEAT repeat domain-containing protein [Thermoflexus sp.]|uniref:HEAT repeat domain-containing protein n=1 Tax=Thermoflexus sp. TaxID=1969742 RepID=UPI0035E44B03